MFFSAKRPAAVAAAPDAPNADTSAGDSNSEKGVYIYIYIQLLLLQYLQTQLRWRMSVIRGRYRSSAERTKASRTSDGSAVAAIQ